MYNTKIGLEFIHENEKCDSEDLRYDCGLEIEIGDKFKKKFFSLKKFKFNKTFRSYKIENLDFLKGKSDIISLIKSSQDGIFIENLLKSYFNIKIDLLDLVSLKEKDRKLIIIKGKSPTDLYIFPYDSSSYISTSEENIITWHKFFFNN